MKTDKRGEQKYRKGYKKMKAAIFIVDTGMYKAKAESAAAAAMKRMLVQVGFEVKAVGALHRKKR